MLSLLFTRCQQETLQFYLQQLICVILYIHYYHGGVPFEFILFDPTSGELSRVGDEIDGQVFQLPVKGGTWKCGRMLLPESAQ